MLHKNQVIILSQVITKLNIASQFDLKTTNKKSQVIKLHYWAVNKLFSLWSGVTRVNLSHTRWMHNNN